MDAVSGINNNRAQTSGAVDKNQLEQKDFLKLLLAQLKLQNPLNPFDASTMMQQISQLTGLNATQKMSDSIDVLKSSLGASQLFEASHMVGKSVQLLSDTLRLSEGAGAAGSVLVPAGVETIQITISDEQGKAVRTFTVNAPGEGVFDFNWDGLDDKGQAVPMGFYKMSAMSSVADNPVTISTAGTFKVDSVALDRDSGKVILNIEGLGGVNMDNLVKIM